MSKNTNLSFLTDYITADITNGRIGINNASPTVAFDVSGATRISGAATFSRNDAANFSVTIANTFINQGNLINFQQNKAGSTINAYIGHGGDNSGNFIINNGNQALTITNAGYVGINTTAPNTSYGATISNPTLYSSNALRLERNGIPTQGLNIIAGGEVVTFNGFNTASDGLNSAFVWTSTAFNTTTERMRITSAGNVGIGTTTIPSKLTVDTGLVTGAGQWASTAIAIYNPTNIGAYSQISFGYTTSTTNAAAYIGFISTNQSSNGFGDLVFGTRSVSTDTQPSEKMRILSGGNVGIGTTAPSQKLEVAGTVLASSFFSATGYSYPVLNVWTTFYTIASDQGMYTISIGLGNNDMATWYAYGTVFSAFGSCLFQSQTNGSLVSIRISEMNIQVLLGTGASFTRELTFKVLRS